MNMTSGGTLYTEYRVVLNMCLLVQVGERREGDTKCGIRTNIDTNLTANEAAVIGSTSAGSEMGMASLVDFSLA